MRYPRQEGWRKKKRGPRTGPRGLPTFRHEKKDKELAKETGLSVKYKEN